MPIFLAYMIIHWFPNRLTKWSILAMALCISGQTQGQIIYFTASTTSATSRMLFKMDLATCTYYPVLDYSFPGNWMCTFPLPNGDIIVSYRELSNQGPGATLRFTPPSNIPIVTMAPVWYGAITAPNGTIYVATSAGANGVLNTFDPITNTLTPIGSMYPNEYLFSFYYYNGELYGIKTNTFTNLKSTIRINFADPGASTVVILSPNISISATQHPNGQVYTIGISSHDHASNSVTPVCVVPPITTSNNPGGYSSPPTGAPIAPCICLSASAGIPNVSNINLCPPATATASFGGQMPDFNDGVNYILYSDQSSPLTSILFQNSTGVFPFVAPLTQGTTYYVACIVADVTGGVVNINDDCLKISPPTTLLWRPFPQLVSVTSNANALCAGDCQTISVTVNGTPPFALGWQWQQNGAAVGFTNSIFNQNTNPITFQACAPSASAGPLELVICGIVDAFCVNQP
jgi:hypothetical protein